ncbi:MAG TPA: alpha/beta hydrolase [Capsulimonadaceae bacterium]|jgi:acetyl esterase/lipase
MLKLRVTITSIAAFIAATACLAITSQARAADIPTVPSAPELLWPAGAPLAQGDGDADKPTLQAYLPSDNVAGLRGGVVICPGGGYARLAMDHEGEQIARWLNAQGIAGFVLKYRLGQRYHHPAELLDAQRAMRLVRSRAAEWRIDPKRVGVIGFSAGGHLASTVGTHFDDGSAPATDPIDRLSCRPDFMMLIYPVITMTGTATHTGSRYNLLGPNPAPEVLEDLSNEKKVDATTPPTLIVYANDDPVNAENGVLFYLALKKAKVPAELHIYESGGHGYGLATGKSIPAADWPTRAQAWLMRHGISAPAK